MKVYSKDILRDLDVLSGFIIERHNLHYMRYAILLSLLIPVRPDICRNSLSSLRADFLYSFRLQYVMYESDCWNNPKISIGSLITQFKHCNTLRFKDELGGM